MPVKLSNSCAKGRLSLLRVLVTIVTGGQHQKVALEDARLAVPMHGACAQVAYVSALMQFLGRPAIRQKTTKKFYQLSPSISVAVRCSKK